MNFDMSNQSNNGLLRFRSAPSSVLQSFLHDIEKPRDGINDGLNYNLVSESYQDLEEEVDLKPNLITGFSLNTPQVQSSHYPRQCTSQASMDSTSSYNRGAHLSSSPMGMGIDNLSQQSKMGSSLLRQNSSPAGLFSHLNHPNGYDGMRGTIGSYRLGNVGNNGDLSPSTTRLKRQMSSSSAVSSLGMLPRISEIEPDTVDPGVLNDVTDYPFNSWELEPSPFIDNFTGLKREIDTRNGDHLGNHPPMLSHHLSLPKTSVEMAAVEKLLHFQDSVPCKIRAKRGCATHPRSIAERVRRTRISERMRKLQELVPHMDKQTNTSDMLDLAVDYIKDLQEQYKVLKDGRANCICSARSGPA